MSDLAIDVRGLSKLYRLGAAPTTQSFRELISGTASSLARRVTGRAKPAAPATDLWALHDVTFSVRQGEVIGIIGSNGAGKSTLLKILSQITDPTHGEADIRGRVASLLEVGTGFHPELTGRENIFLNGTILGMTRREIAGKLDSIIDFSGVEKFLDTPVKNYSSGMTVRLAFAVAAHLEPEILIIDEVLAVGDAAFQSKCLGKMREVATGEGRTVLFVSHNMGAIRSLCSRAIMLERGRMIADAEPGPVIERYYADALSQAGEGEVHWPDPATAPGGDAVTLRSVRLLGADGRVRADFGVHEPVRVELRHRVHAPVTGMRLIVQLITGEGAVALASTDHDRRAETTPPGEYVTTCTVPAGLLNRGRYIVSVNAGVPGMRVLVPGVECLAFTTSGAGNHGSHYPETWPGAVAPRLDWQTVSQTSLRSAA